jgi:hypothetical protein
MTVRHSTHLSSWLRKTGLAEYLSSKGLDAVANLLALPCLYAEPGLAALLQAFNELGENARASIRANSFVPGRHFKRPLLFKLQDKMYRAYRLVWHKLLCFVHWIVVLLQPPNCSTS